MQKGQLKRTKTAYLIKKVIRYWGISPPKPLTTCPVLDTGEPYVNLSIYTALGSLKYFYYRPAMQNHRLPKQTSTTIEINHN